MGKIAGIDLGTTFSALSILNDNGKPEIVKNEDGYYITPSVVGFPSDREGHSVVGEDAKDLLTVEPNRVIKEVKRDMGSDKEYSIAGKDFTPTGISSMILKKLVQDAEKQFGKIDDIVVTVPANFDEAQRQATMQAGRDAGINLKNIIDEPTAAALHYAFSNPISGKIMIYDFGGGTFDITIAEVTSKDITCLTSQGDSHLGGTDIDRIILEELKEFYKNEKKVDLLNDSNERNEMFYMFEAEKIKKGLAKKDRHKYGLQGSEGQIIVEFTKEKFEESIKNLMSKIDALIDVALSEKNLTEKDISDILLVGGSSRIPLVTKNIRKRFGKDPLTGVNVDEAIALGASLYAGKKASPSQLSATQEAELNRIDLNEVCNGYFGTIVTAVNQDKQEYEEKVAIMIPKNTPLPCSKTETFFTMSEGQTKVSCDVTRSTSEETDPSFVQLIWKGDLGNLPPNRPAGQAIVVTYSYDDNGMMKCKFKDSETGEEQLVDLTINNQEADGTSANDFLID